MTESRKKIILWSAAVIAAGSLFLWWVKNAQKIMNNFRGGEFTEKLNFPNIETPDIKASKEDLKNQVQELGEIIKNVQEISTTTE